MSQPEIEQQEEPLDPAMERIRRKMVLLQLVSGGIMFVCFMAVLGAIVYKINQRPDEPSTAIAAPAGSSVPADHPMAATAVLPRGFTVESTAISGNQILFYGRVDGAAKALVFDLSVGRVIADVTVDTGR